MNLGADELRLAYTIILNVVVFAASFRFARARARNVIDALVDAFLLYYLVQYVTIGALGLLGFLTPVAIAIVALAISVALWVCKTNSLSLVLRGEGRGEGQGALEVEHRSDPIVARPSPLPSPRVQGEGVNWAISIAICFFTIGYATALCHNQRFLPVMFNDALTYHVPAAVHWLQSGRMALFETWFYNPANTYSPLVGSMFIAWLIAPMQNDIFAKFVELGPLLLILFAMIALARRLGVNLVIASIIAMAAVMSRPFISQAIAAKDDLFVSAFALAGLVALTDGKDRWGPYRAGVAIGLMLATKYTAVYSLAVIFLAIDAPRRAGWRKCDYALAFSIALILVAPWYLRNWMQTGNPLFPMRVSLFGQTIFSGLIIPARSDRLGTWQQMIDTLVTGYYAPTWPVAVALVILWLTSIVILRKRLLRDPLIRTITLAPPLLVAIFLASTPYAEMRFIYPAILLMFACAAVVLSKFPRVPAIAVGSTIAIISILTHGFGLELTIQFAITGVVVAACAIGLWLLREMRQAARIYTIVGCTLAGVSFIIVFVQWPHYIDSIEQSPAQSWPTQYGTISDAWVFIHRETPSDSTIAYTNTHFVHPLHGFRNSRRAIYIPTRHGIKRLADLPPLTETIPGEKLTTAIDIQTLVDPDQQQWLTSLLASGAKYLFINIDNADHPGPPPELAFVQADPARFTPVFRSNSAAVFAIKR